MLQTNLKQKITNAKRKENPEEPCSYENTEFITLNFSATKTQDPQGFTNEFSQTSKNIHFTNFMRPGYS